MLTGAERSRRWRAANLDKARAKARAWAERNRDSNRARSAAWRAANGVHVALYGAVWAKNNRAKINATHAKRRAAEHTATPRWADPAEIATIYEAAALTGCEVDHIVPLVSPKVCGLHCPANLQLLPRGENRAKGNRYWPDMFEEKNT